MSNTPAGGQKVRDTNLAKDPEYYSKLGRLGGAVKNPQKGFGSDKRNLIDKLLGHEKLAVRAGRIGGTVSKRRPKIVL